MRRRGFDSRRLHQSLPELPPARVSPSAPGILRGRGVWCAESSARSGPFLRRRRRGFWSLAPTPRPRPGRQDFPLTTLARHHLRPRGDGDSGEVQSTELLKPLCRRLTPDTLLRKMRRSNEQRIYALDRPEQPPRREARDLDAEQLGHSAPAPERSDGAHGLLVERVRLPPRRARAMILARCTP